MKRAKHKIAVAFAHAACFVFLCLMVYEHKPPLQQKPLSPVDSPALITAQVSPAPAAMNGTARNLWLSSKLDPQR